MGSREIQEMEIEGPGSCNQALFSTKDTNYSNQIGNYGFPPQIRFIPEGCRRHSSEDDFWRHCVHLRGYPYGAAFPNRIKQLLQNGL